MERLFQEFVVDNKIDKCKSDELENVKYIIMKSKSSLQQELGKTLFKNL